jgi:transcriptional regulator with XRE-family HTH domain
MPSGEQRRIGQRIADLRKVRRLTQRQLAADANVSLSLLQKVESGARAATPVLVAAVAPVLRASVRELYGQPFTGANDRVHAAIPMLHGALVRYDIPLEPDSPPRPYELLETATGEVNRSRQKGSYTGLGEKIPGLLDELSAVMHTATGTQRERIGYLLALVYFAAHSLAYKLGHDQLATLAEDRMVWAANASADPAMVATANWTRCTSLMATGGYRAGLRLLEDTRRTMEPLLAGGDHDRLSVQGGLHLREGIMSARSGDASAAWAHIEEANELVRRGASDANDHYQLTCGPVNCAIVAVAVAVELGNAAEAIRRAEGLRIPPGFTPVRASHHYIDLARAFLWQGERRRALEALLEAERYAPQQARHHPMTHETLGVLVHLERRCPDTLLGLLDRITRSGGPAIRR